MKTDVMVKKRILKTFKAISITLVVLLIMFQAGSVLAGPARLDDSPVAFAIASQTLAGALADFQNDSGVNVIYKDRLVQAKTTPGLSGQYSPAAGLKKLLAGTGLLYQVTAENTVVLKENKMVVAQREVEKREAAEEKEEAKRPVEMEQMTVTATKTPIKVQEVPASVSVVTSEDIKLRARTDNYYDALRSVPGVFVKKAGFQDDIYLRGKFPSIMVNGRDMNTFLTSGSLITSSMNVGTGAIERIEVLKGPQGAIYGSKAVSGVLNVILKKGDKDNPYVETRGFYGEGDELSGGLSLSGGYDKSPISLIFIRHNRMSMRPQRGISRLWITSAKMSIHASIMHFSMTMNLHLNTPTTIQRIPWAVKDTFINRLHGVPFTATNLKIVGCFLRTTASFQIGSLCMPL